MDPRVTDEALAYLLGQLTGAERTAFERQLQQDGALRREVTELQAALTALAASAPPVPPPPAVREAVLAAFATRGNQSGPPGAAPVLRPRGSPAARILFRSLAAAAVVVAGVSTVGYFQLRARLRGSEARVHAAELALLGARDDLHSAVTDLAQRNIDLQSTADRLRAAQSELAQAQEAQTKLLAENTSLRSQVATLERSEALNTSRIAVLGSLLKNQPKAVGVSLWRQSSQKGVLVVENFPALPADQDYQLWIIDEANPVPVSAGTFRVDAQGKVRMEFQPTRAVTNAFKFAVTVEPSGGSATPHLDKMVVVGQ